MHVCQARRRLERAPECNEYVDININFSLYERILGPKEAGEIDRVAGLPLGRSNIINHIIRVIRVITTINLIILY